MTLTDKHVQNVCRIGQGEKTCAFLSCGHVGWDCIKKTMLGDDVQKQLEAGTTHAKGNNCSGPPHFAMFDV